MKKYTSSTEEDNKPPIWVTNPVDIHNLGEVQSFSLGDSTSTPTHEEVEKDDIDLPEDYTI